MYQARLLITGKVQGVFYRASCQEIAQRLGLSGWVKNLSDGNVEALVQGEKVGIEKLINWCKKGPPDAVVSNLNVNWETVIKQITSFKIVN
jgi:acylphosphatase